MTRRDIEQLADDILETVVGNYINLDELDGESYDELVQDIADKIEDEL